jgi:hypothetical protein
MKSGRSLVDLAKELERQIATKQDLVLPSSLLQCRTDAGGNLKLIVEAGHCPGLMNSHTQIGGDHLDNIRDEIETKNL